VKSTGTRRELRHPDADELVDLVTASLD